MNQIAVISAPILGDEVQRFAVHEGATVAEIVVIAFPVLAAAHYPECRVTLVSPDGRCDHIPSHLWQHVRPKRGTQIVLRMRPSGENGRSLLLIVIAAAASAVGPWLGGLIVPQAGFLQSAVGGLITAGLIGVGSLLINKLIPLPTVDDSTRAQTYAVSGWRNRIREGEPVPLVLGRMRYAPPFAAGSYTEIVGDDQYVRALFCFGYGPVQITDLRIGDTPIDRFDEVDIEIREGRATDTPVTLYPRQVIEDPTNVELVRPFPRDDAGDVVEGSTSEETPVRRFTARDTAEASIILAFPSGLYEVTDDGEERDLTVDVRIRERAEDGINWIDVERLSITAKTRSAFFRQYRWTLRTRGRAEIEITRMTDERTSTRVSDQVRLSAVQSIRPEYPIALTKPLALVALRIRATYQLSGSLEEVNALVQREAPIHAEGTWTDGPSRNPASAFRIALQSNASPYPVPDSAIDLAELGAWHDWCAAQGLKYDRVHDRDEALGDTLSAICAAGRAMPIYDGTQWTVAIDRATDLVIDHINARNSELSWSRPYFEHPDGFRVAFQDETNEFETAERIVPWPGHTGDVEITETINLPGKTDPDEIWTEARRQMYELIHRPDFFTITTDFTARAATRGDQVIASFPELDRSIYVGRVKSTAGSEVELDELVTLDDGVAYGMRYRVYDSADDTIGRSVLAPIVSLAGERRVLALDIADAMPAAESLVHVGPIATASMALRIRAVEPSEDMTTVWHLLAAAPEIDDLVANDPPPAWNGRVGAEIDTSGQAPATPTITRIDHGYAGTGDVDALRVYLAPAPGPVPVAQYMVMHRLVGASSFASTVAPAATGHIALTSYSFGDSVELQVRALAQDATASPATALQTVVIGSDDLDIPNALERDAAMITGGFGHARIEFATGGDPALAKVQIYRVPAGTALDPSVHALGEAHDVTLATTMVYVDGDATRVELLDNGSFDTTSVWTADASWTIASGNATHAATSAGDLSQPLALEEGVTYRGALDVVSQTAGTVTPELTGGTDQAAAPVSATGRNLFSISAATGNTAFNLAASADSDAEIAAVSLYRATDGCAPQGAWDYYIEPQNRVSQSGPIMGPLSATII